jgi:hypothetical protein
MGYIPPDAEWYIAELVQELRVPGRRRNHVWINTVLVHASPPEEAYDKSLKLGRDGNHSYKNVYGKKVGCKFHGIRELMVIGDPLEHGCELFFRSKLLDEKGIKRQISKKNNLAVFEQRRRLKGWKTMMPKNIAKELKEKGLKL